MKKSFHYAWIAAALTFIALLVSSGVRNTETCRKHKPDE